MNIKLVKLTHEYKQQLTDMMDEWLAVEQDFSPYAIRKSDYHDFDSYLENLELKEARYARGADILGMEFVRVSDEKAMRLR